MPTKSTPTPPPVPHHILHHDAGAHHASELARITTGLFVGILALMTFLLTAGLQHPQPIFAWFVYASLIILPLSLVVFTLTHTMQRQAPAAPADPKVVPPTNNWSGLRIMRVIQQVLFILSIIAVTGLALVSAHIFFAPAPAAQSQAQTQQAQ